VHLARRDGVEALRWADRLIAKEPNNAGYLLLLGDARALHGEADAAHTAWTQAARGGIAAARQRLDDE
jgi:cytochrome c-type biogenesis protein CcmH/NrfG